jgi:DNA-binding response OmpR family regulator
MPPHDEAVVDLGRPRPCRVLVVDDDPLVCRVVAACLRAKGFDVLPVADTSAAATLAAHEPAPFLLALVDLGRDGGGKALAERLRQLSPGLPVVPMGGDKVTGLRGPLLDAGFGGYLQKPFAAAHLLAEVRRALPAGP